jgi:hypothetical protein
MSITITETELLGMPESLLLELRSYLNSVRAQGNPSVRWTQSATDLGVATNDPGSPVAEENTNHWRFDEHGLTISETLPDQHPAGLRIDQTLDDGIGRPYIAVKWCLNSQLRNIVDLALVHGFDKLWQINHPQEAYYEDNSKFDIGVKYISFSRSHTDRWFFAVDVSNSKPPDVRVVVFEKQQRGLVERVLGKALPKNEPARPGRWKEELYGGRNILVHPSDLEKILEGVNQ